MRFAAIIPLILLSTLLLAQGPGEDSDLILIKKLGSANYQHRQAAVEALKQRPEAAAALREAMSSADLETRRRADEILRYFDRRPIRELEAAAKEGRVDRFVELLAAWQTGKYEDEAWDVVRDFARRMADLHDKQGGAKNRRANAPEEEKGAGTVVPSMKSRMRVSIAFDHVYPAFTAE